MGDIKNLRKSEAANKIKELAKAADICMFTTSLTKLPLSSRPMSTIDVDEEGNIWFLSNRSSEKNKEISADDKVQLFYASKGSAEYLSVFGRASLSFDRNKIKELWTPIAKAWFTGGVDDPAISIIKVTPEDGYYWDTQSNKVISLLKILTATITGRSMDDGIEGKVNPQ